jgi:predicted nuclease of restriction endonuclease-like RecB superfamily
LLTADLVHTRRRGDRLTVVPLAPADRARARELAATYLDLARAHLGATRGALLEAWRAVVVGPGEQRLARGLVKLVLDRCEFEEGAGLDPAALRDELFSAAALARRRGPGAIPASSTPHPGLLPAGAGPGRDPSCATDGFDRAAPGRDPSCATDGFDRAALLAAAAARRGVSVEDVEKALYADLPDAHLVRAFAAVSADALVESYDLAQVQAVLLRAVKVTATVRAGPAAYRYLFRRLKFLRLLHRIHRLPERRGGLPGGYAVEIDGPYALFESVTRYGLQLALAFPAIAACTEWALAADLRWGRDARSLRFELNGETSLPAGTPEDGLRDEVAALLEQLRAADTPWRAAISAAVLDMPGAGLCVPDLELTHSKTGQTVYLEVLGFWSREAVWKRIELVERGLPYHLVFAVSKRLRVSEEALGDQHPAALYVYGKTMSARAVLERVQAAIK